MRIGIDLGGSKIEAIVLDGDGHERFRRRVPTPRDSYEGTLAAIVLLVESAEHEAGRCTVGVAMPGVMSPATGVVKNANSTWLNGRPFERDLRLRLGRPVRLANDANCFALSEAVDGAGAGCATVFGVIIGTGTGGGIVINGTVVVGANAIAGEWGHNPLPWPGEDELPGPGCYCGRRGCIETFLSGPGLSRDHASRAGETLEAVEIARRAEHGDAACRETMMRYQHRMARALASIVNVLDPDVIVLGGGMSNIRSLYDRVSTLWAPYVFSDVVTTRIVPNRHGDSSGVRGAAWLWPEPGAGERQD